MNAQSPQPRTQNRGQALLELAIFGMVAMAALGLLIRIGMQANFDQEIRMGAFRRALAAAAADDERGPQGGMQDALSVSYYYMLDRQVPNPSDAFLGLTRNRSQASAFVERGRWLTFAYEDAVDPEAGRRTHPRVLVRLNDQEMSFRDNQFPCHDSADFTCHDPSADPVDDTTAAIIRETWTTNRQDPSSTVARQSETGSSVSSTTRTESKAAVNLMTNGGATACGAEGVLCSTLSSSVNVGWSH